MEIRLKRVPFNIELAKKITNKEAKGRIVTDDGHEVRIICYDYRHFGGKNRLVALIDLGDNEIALSYNNEGKEIDNREKFAIHLEVPTYFRNYSNFKPCKWQPVLVRDLITDMWIARVATGERTAKGFRILSVAGENKFFAECLPISKLTIKLLGTSMSYDELLEKTW